MKKVICFFTIFLVPLYIQSYNVHLQRIEEVGNGKEKRAPMLLPTVYYEDNVLELCNSFPLMQVTIVIRNNDGEEIFLSTADVYTRYITTIPDDVTDEMYTIELFYGCMHLIGHF